LGATDGVFPHARAVINEIEDERRLFYVAATRAVNKLVFTHAERANRSAGGISRFLTELGLAPDLD
jgi:DNA helicase-2/ATP-dependent DNA helicase PcrA